MRVEPSHGLTFALLHLACMQMLSVVAPRALAATAQAIYGGVAVGTMTDRVRDAQDLDQCIWVEADLVASIVAWAHSGRLLSTLADIAGWDVSLFPCSNGALITKANTASDRALG